MNLAHEYIVLECNVDWITATAGNGVRGNALHFQMMNNLEERGTEGYQIKPWYWNGYAGEVVDGCSVGKRADGTIVRLSGPMATRYWLSMMALADNVSRFDIQTTILDRKGEEDYAYHAFRKAGEAELVQSGLTHTKYTQSTPDGSTCNIGSRSSDRYFRVYDKTAETDGEYPNRSWRYEIEYKSRRAHHVASDLARARNLAPTIYDRLAHAFATYGVGIPGPVPSLSFRDAGIVHATDDQRRLEWVRRCIRPMVGRLVEAYDGETVARALGFTLYPNESAPAGVAWEQYEAAEVLSIL